MDVIYRPALAAAGEPDTPRNRQIALADYWQFLQLGGGDDAEATAALVRGLRSCEAKANLTQR
jgi:hypothetical protein